MTLYGYARVSVREPEDKNLDLQVERLVRSGSAICFGLKPSMFSSVAALRSNLCTLISMRVHT